jgi:hypothetical protein
MTSARTTSAVQSTSDAEFVEHLCALTQRYLDAIDAWEAAHQKYYRMPPPGPVSSDLASEHEEYLAAREQLRRNLPRARQLCLKHSLRDPWPAMLHVKLGSRTPQNGAASAIGRAERKIVAQCLADLELACRIAAVPSDDRPVAPPPERTGVFRKIIDYFL